MQNRTTYDLNQLHNSYENDFTKERGCGKTTINCFNTAGLIDVCLDSTIIVKVKTMKNGHHFAMELKRVLDFMQFLYTVRYDKTTFSVLNTNNFLKTIVINSDTRKDLRGTRSALIYNIDENNLANCELDYTYSDYAKRFSSPL